MSILEHKIDFVALVSVTALVVSVSGPPPR